MAKDAVRFIIVAMLISSGCAPQSREDQAAKQEEAPPISVDTTYEPPKPTIVKEQGYKIARGATKLVDVKAHYSPENLSMSLTGAIEYLPVGGGSYKKIDLELKGLLDSDGFIVMKPEAGAPVTEGMKVAAKATCLSAKGTCDESFVDIYLYTDGVVYHHQIEVKAESKKDSGKSEDSGSQKDTRSDSQDKNDPLDKEETESDHNEGGSDSADGAPGPYIGSVLDDIEQILEVEPDKTDERLSKEDRDERSEKEKSQKAQEDKSSQDSKNSSGDTSTGGKKTDGGSQQGAGKKDSASPSTSPSPAPTVTPKTPTTGPGQKNEKDQKSADSGKESVKEAGKEAGKETGKDTSKDKDEKSDPQLPTTGPRPDARPETKQESEPQIKKNKPVSQAIGAVNAGSLENAVNMKAVQDSNSASELGWFILRPERKTHFATNEISYLIQVLNTVTKKILPGYKVALGDMSREHGGHLGNHKSHTNGLDADIAYYFDQKSLQGDFISSLDSRGHASSHWMTEKQWELYKNLVRTQFVDRIFIHEALKKQICKLAIKNGEVTESTKQGPVYETLRRLIADEDHDTHFHLRAKCSQSQIKCRQMAEPAPGTGCF